MGKIGYGYGSEWQLMRFLGHHRNRLDEEIKKQIGERGDLHWLDFNFSDSDKNITGDEELKGLDFLKKLPFVSKQQQEKVKEEACKYEITGIDTSWQNWDAIFYIEDRVYLVEAKAHTGELSGDKNNGGKSKDGILDYMKNMLPNLPVSEEWVKEYYQLANRLATAALLHKHNIKAKVLYLFFENGYKKISYRKINKSASKGDFKKAMEAEKKALGISDEKALDKIMARPVFIDAEGKVS